MSKTVNYPTTPEHFFGRPRACSKSEDLAKMASAAEATLNTFANAEVPDIADFKDVPEKYRAVVVNAAMKEVGDAAAKARENMHDWHRALILGAVQNILKDKTFFQDATPAQLRDLYRATLEFQKNNPTLFTR